jgi:hypothetical protein
MDPIQFSNRLRSLRKKITLQQERSDSNKSAHDHDRELFPIGAVDTSGLPRWDGSAAMGLLKEDLANGQYIVGQPKLLYKSRPEYQVFSLTVFRRHIHQEIDTSTQKYYKQKAVQNSKGKK